MARDQFQTNDPSEYDVDEIWKGSSDKQGHSAHIRVPVPKHWSGQIQSIIHNDKFDYKSPQEFARDAIYHRLRWASEKLKDEKFQARLGVDKLQAHVEHYVVEAEGYREFTARLDEAAALAQSAGDSKEFAALIDLMRDEADVTLREPFRTEAVERLESMYTLFLAHAQVAETRQAVRDVEAG